MLCCSLLVFVVRCSLVVVCCLLVGRGFVVPWALFVGCCCIFVVYGLLVLGGSLLCVDCCVLFRDVCSLFVECHVLCVVFVS